MENLITFRGSLYIECIDSLFHIKKIEWADKWMDVPADELPGTLTHDKVVKASIDSEHALIDYQRF